MGRDLLALIMLARDFKFQSTRPHGARRWKDLRDSSFIGFNPRARMGRDPERQGVNIVLKEFQSTRPHGARRGILCPVIGSSQFQSTRPHGARRSTKHMELLTLMCFNPRARMGRDANPSHGNTRRSSFNPRARMGRDSALSKKPKEKICFNPRARMGRDY